MSITLRKRSMLPTFAEKFFETGSLLPGIFDFDGELFDFNEKMIIPDANVIETEKEFKIELAAPGLEKKDFKIEVDKEVLTISVEKEEMKKEDKDNFRRREFSYNSFFRSFRLPENLLSDKIDAHYENGILKLVLPKKEVTVLKTKKEIKVV